MKDNTLTSSPSADGNLQKILNYWNELCFKEIDPQPIAAFRILFGIYLLIYFFSQLPHVEMMYSNQGVYSPFWLPDITPAPWIALLIHLFLIACTISFIIGWQTRFVTPLILLIFLYYFFINLSVKNCSYDRLIIVFLFLMSLAYNQIDKAFAPRSPKEAKVSAWLTRLLCVQVTIFYLGTGVFKSFAEPWQNGEILKMTMASMWGTPAAFKLLSLNLPMWFYDVMTKGIVYFELVWGFLLWFKKIQKPVFILGIFFHLTVWVFLSIPEFMICPITYVLFMPSHELKKIAVSLFSPFNKLFNSGNIQ